jgi:CPA2 family monovalent cation:H+ antiporter-2
VQVAVTGVVVVALASIAGQETATAIVLGMVVALSSTAVVLRVLVSRAELDSAHGHAAIAILLAQDFVTVLFLLLLPELGDPPPFTEALADIALLVGKLAMLIAGIWIADRLVVRRIFVHVSSGAERELVAILALVAALGAAGISDLLGLSSALGAFVAGMIIGEARYGDQVRSEIAPVYTALLVLFFAWVGMLVDLDWMIEHLPQVLAGAICVLVLKTGVTSGVLRLSGSTWRYALLAGVSVAQLGEFSLVIATQGLQLDILSENIFQGTVSVVVLTLLVTPTLISRGAAWAHGGKPQDEGDASNSHSLDLRNHGVVVGFGPAGKRVVHALVSAGIPTVVIDVNPNSYDGVSEDEMTHWVSGDAGRVEILTKAAVSDAQLAVLTIPEQLGIGRVIGQMRHVAPDLPIVARGRYHIFLDRILEAGADEVVDEESYVGDEMARRAMSIVEERTAHHKLH